MSETTETNPDENSQKQQETDKKLENLAENMIRSTGDYIKCEIDACVADYKLLEKMNNVVAEKYQAYTDLAKSISSEMIELNEGYAALYPLLSQIGDIEKCVGDLEQSASKLDAYSRKLEAKYKQYCEKRA